MVQFDGNLLVVNYDRDEIYALDSSDNVTIYPLPTGYLVGASYIGGTYIDYNLMVVVGSNLYLVAEKQSPFEQTILRTPDLNSWYEMAGTSEKLISLTYWADKNWLVATTPGTNAKLLRLDLGGSPTAVTLRFAQAHPFVSPPLPAMLFVVFLLTFPVIKFLMTWPGLNRVTFSEQNGRAQSQDNKQQEQS
jgi:hypothetical protein